MSKEGLCVLRSSATAVSISSRLSRMIPEVENDVRISSSFSYSRYYHK